MTGKQWTAFGTIGTFVTVLIGIWQFGSKDIEISEVEGSTINVATTIGVQNNVYENTLDPTWENPREPELRGLSGKDLIETWFALMNTKQWPEACSLMTKDKCDTKNGEDVLEHSREPRLKTVNGYEDVSIWHANNAPNDLWCVKYKYQERQSLVPRDIVLIMQYKLSPRSDGSEDIASRLCEKTWMSGIGERSCSIPASIKFCS